MTSDAGGRISGAAADLYVGLQVRHPGLGSVLISGVSTPGAAMLGLALQNSVIEAGSHASHIAIASDGSGPSDALLPHGFLDLEAARSFVREQSQAKLLILTTEDFIEFSPSRILAASVQGVVLVAAVGRTSIGSLRQARELLTEAGGKLLGSVSVVRPVS